MKETATNNSPFGKFSGGEMIFSPSDYLRIVSVYKISIRKETLWKLYTRKKSTLIFCYWKRVSITIK